MGTRATLSPLKLPRSSASSQAEAASLLDKAIATTLPPSPRGTPSDQHLAGLPEGSTPDKAATLSPHRVSLGDKLAPRAEAMLANLPTEVLIRILNLCDDASVPEMMHVNRRIGKLASQENESRIKERARQQLLAQLRNMAVDVQHDMLALMRSAVGLGR